MKNKEISKKYLTAALLLYCIGAVFILVLIWALTRLKGENTLSLNAALAVSALCPLVPLGSYTGFVRAGLKIKEIKTKHAVLLVAFYPLVLVFVTVYGIVMIIPSLVSSIINLTRG